MIRTLSLALAATLTLARGQVTQIAPEGAIPVRRAIPVGREAEAALAALLPAAPTVGGPQPKSGAFSPTWETQKNARNFIFGIPAPRGQIVDRHGLPLAQNRVAQNLAITFPAPAAMSDREVFSYTQQQLARAQAVMGTTISLPTEQVLKHYKNRAMLPLVIAQDLSLQQIENFDRVRPANLALLPAYLRYYPQGSTAAHIVGYAGRAGKFAEGAPENNELLWPNAEGREGLEQTFDDSLNGKMGQMNVAFDAQQKKVSEQVMVPPQPGFNVVTTIDLPMQQLCERVLAANCKRGACVIIDPNNGDVLAMASWPTFDPNLFIPTISGDQFRLLQNDPNRPLQPRAYRYAYPPGSTFKVITGLAAMQSGKVDPHDEFSCPASLRIGNLSFPNWKKGHAGSLNFADALTQSCNTYFYQVGIKTGWRPMWEYAQRCGLGMRTGIPLAYEAEGRIPDDDFMLKAHKRKMGDGDKANMSIGQGDVEVTPLQLAQAMGVIGNGGTLVQARLVQQVQTIDGQIVTAYNVRARGQIDIDREVMKEMRRGLVQVTEAGLGTAHRAKVPGVKVAGKTGTAQWYDKGKEHTAAWFAGFIPATNPKYAFAALYESDAHNAEDVHGGTQAAPIIGKVMGELFKKAAPEKKKTKKKKTDDEEMEDEAMDDDGTPVKRAQPVDPVEKDDQ